MNRGDIANPYLAYGRLMGIYDRDYYKEAPRHSALSDWSAVTTLIAINVAVFLVEMFSDNNWIESHLGLRPNLFSHPWQAWQLLTHAFVHDSRSLQHILFNMIALWIFGVDVERIYGRKEFFRIYLAFAISAGLVWVTLETAAGHDLNGPGAVGASGAIMGIIFVYICHYPTRQFLLFFAIPVPAWMLGVIYVGLDFAGVVSPARDDNVAHFAHLGGALAGLVYFRTGWSLASLVPQRLPNWLRGRRPKLRVRRDDDRDDQNPYRSPTEMQNRVDELLEKISRQGEASLSDDERRELEEASRRLRNRR